MIVRLSDLTDDQASTALAVVRRIFFESSVRQSFASDAAREAFWETWTGWYRREAPHDILLYRQGDGTVAGYLTGCRDSAAARALFDIIPGYRRFADLFADYPAHLHINVSADCRGTGVGAALIDAFCADHGTGTHLVTAPGARNVAFYTRCGFTHAVAREGALFLGRPAG